MAFPPVPFQEWFLRQTSAGNAALNAYVARVKADGGVVEAIGCVPLAVWDWAAPSFVGLLDLFPNAAAAYSLRKLRAAYSGAAVRVRESGGNTEADIGFTSAGELDTAALLTHCGANNGLSTIKYDQAASINAGQTLAANQPTIVSSGTIVDINGNPSNDFDTSDFFVLSQPFEGGILPSKQNFTALIVSEFGASGANKEFIACTFSLNDRFFIRQITTGEISIGLGDVVRTSTFTVSGNDGVLIFVDYDGGEITMTKVSDGTTETFSSITFGDDWGTVSFSPGLSGNAGISVNTFSGTGSSINGKLGELVIWPSNLSGSTLGLRNNVKGFWGI